ncbi:hypothetical protein SDRG_09778 [Saprolegnia diclina VS20]|uniref:WW domain-containing protein n=1 Tax=Saprolegnia diclina (strain VS20) TaxID=1156394 RepID=T0QCP8_SAPDV|nr:hypothetical protein SDRG_09778 [Saprolegnia diclina VS20]EQC32451.1 hypothetical protein SDRG_09778 [Saprolegnia diclina VS20]|eukprot:XP_008613952.1 hypothetical protein SDRG_09778 [Saprolegnia diclina VS20]
MAAEVPTASESLLVIDAASDLLPIIPSDNQTSPLPKEAPEMPSLAKTTPPPAPLPHRRLSKHAIEAASVKVVASTEVAEPSKLDATADAEPTAPEKTSPPKPILVPSGAPRSHRDDAPEPASSMHFEMYEDDSDETPLLEAKSDATSSPIYDDEWVVCQTEVGYAYYYNTRTHASQWEAPLADDNGRDAFFSAVTAGDVGATTRLLLRHGRQLLDATDHNGRSAVWYALGHMSMAQLLFESGANLDLTDVDANGLVHVATRQRNIAFLTLLAVYGANLDLADGAQQTALHIAAACGYQRCVDVLLRHGATPDVLDSAARSPLQLSTLGNHVSCVQLLQTASAQPAERSDTALLAQRAEFEREMQKALAQCDELQQRYTTLETAHRIANARIVMLEAVVDRCEKDLDAERALLWQKEQAFNDAQQAQYATLQDLQRQVDDVVQFAARSRCEVTALSESHAPERESAGPLYVEEDDATSLEPSDTIAFDDDEMNGVVKVDETPIAPERVGAIWSAFFNNAAKARAHDDGPSKVLDAVYDGDLVTLQALLVHGASPDSRNDDDQTPLHIA